jgi:PAS domain S-box-containing protein
MKGILPHTYPVRYGVAIAAVLIALFLTLQVDFLAERMSLALFFAAIISATWYGGRRPGLVSQVLSIVVAEYFIIVPRSRGELVWDVSAPLFTFIPLTLLIIWLISAYQHRAISLRAGEARYRLLFENNPMPMWVFDQDTMEFLAVNEAAVVHYGYTRKEFLSMKLLDIRPLEDHDSLKRAIAAEIPGKMSVSIWRHLRKDGSLIDVEVTTYELAFNGKRGRLVLANDITARRKAETEILELNATLEKRVKERTAGLEKANQELLKNRAVFKNLFESLPGLYLILTPDLEIVTASDAYLKATMTTLDGITGRGLFDVFPDNPDDSEATGVSNLLASLDRVRKDKKAHVMAIQKYDVRRPDGIFEEHYWSPINSPVFGTNNKIEYIIHRVENVTDFMRQKSRDNNESPESNSRLEQMEAEIYQSSQKIQEINRQLAAANKELESFSYSVSHDLRAPLRHINGYSQALLEDCDDQLNEVGRGYIKELRGASQEMGQLIEDLLHLSKVTRTEVRLENVDLSEIVANILKGLQKRDPGRKASLDIDTGLKAYGDRRLLTAALTNLLENAWKFTSKKDATEIVFGQDHADGAPRFFVRDNGAGFDRAYADKLFGAFQRLHSVADFEGTGIGLATVSRIISRHGGRVWAEGEIDKGATFYFTLPDSQGV